MDVYACARCAGHRLMSNPHRPLLLRATADGSVAFHPFLPFFVAGGAYYSYPGYGYSYPSTVVSFY